MNDPTVVSIAPSGSMISQELQTYVTIVDTDELDLVDALSSMKVAPQDTVFLMDSQRAVFLVNNAAHFNMTFRIFHPTEDDLEKFNAAWLGLEKFNSFVKEDELIAKYDVPAEEEEPKQGKRFGHQYARLNKDKDPVPLRKPTYTHEHETDDDQDEE